MRATCFHQGTWAVTPASFDLDTAFCPFKNSIFLSQAPFYFTVLIKKIFHFDSVSSPLLSPLIHLQVSEASDGFFWVLNPTCTQRRPWNPTLTAFLPAFGDSDSESCWRPGGQWSFIQMVALKRKKCTGGLEIPPPGPSIKVLCQAVGSDKRDGKVKSGKILAFWLHRRAWQERRRGSVLSILCALSLSRGQHFGEAKPRFTLYPSAIFPGGWGVRESEILDLSHPFPSHSHLDSCTAASLSSLDRPSAHLFY